MSVSPQRLPARDRVVLLAALATVVALSWLYLLAGAGMPMRDVAEAMAPVAADWTPAYAGVVFVMWTVMMIAMMFPSAAPMVLAFAAIDRRRPAQRGAPGTTVAFVLGYAAVWSAFAAAAVGLQYALARGGLLSHDLGVTSAAVAGAILVGAGLYQWTPFKKTCLEGCRSPLDFLLAHWASGRRGALRMGALHGAYCLGCCWAAMLLLFVGGVMNLVWIALLSGFLLLEKTAPGASWVSRSAGLALILWGAFVLWSGTPATTPPPGMPGRP